MKRMFFCIGVALLLTSALQGQAATPSKTVGAMTYVVDIYNEKMESVKAQFSITPVEDDEVASTVRTHLQEYVEAPLAYFPEDVQTAFAQALPEGKDTNFLRMYEFVALVANNYDPAIGVVGTWFVFPTPYDVEHVQGALLGLKDGWREDGQPMITWQVLPATSAKEQVMVWFPPEVLLRLEKEGAMLAVLSDIIGE